MSIDHSTHGRGTAEEGPEDSDCSCRSDSWGQRVECARTGCGFCRAQVDRDDDTDSLVPYNSDWKHKKTGNKYLVIVGGFVTNATNAQDGQKMVVYANKDGDVFTRELEEFLQKFEYVPTEMWF